jgi:hypothetical protein
MVAGFVGREWRWPLKAPWKFARASGHTWHPQVCMNDSRGNYVACLAGPLGRATCNLRLKSQSAVTLRDIVREGT